MSQPDPLVIATAPAPQPARVPAAPAPTPSRLTDASHAAGAARLSVDNQPGYDEQARQRSPGGLDTHALTTPPGVGQRDINALMNAIGSLEGAVSGAERKSAILEARIGDWIAADQRTTRTSEAFATAMTAAVRAERRREVIESMLGVIDLTKAFAKLASATELPSLADMTDLAAATNGVRTIGTARKVASGIVGSGGRSRVLGALDALGVRVRAIEETNDQMNARNIEETLGNLQGDLSEAQRATASATRSMGALAYVAPTSAALPAARQSLGDALRRIKRIEARLSGAQGLLRAIERSRPATLAPGGTVRGIVDGSRRDPSFVKGLSLVQKVHLEVTVDGAGTVLGERRHNASVHVRAEGVPAQLRMETLSVKATDDVGALGAAALTPILGPPREELVDVTLKTESPSGPTKTIPAEVWESDPDGARLAFARLSRQVDEYEAKSAVRYAR